MVKRRSIRTHDAAELNHVCEQIITCMKQLDSIEHNRAHIDGFRKQNETEEGAMNRSKEEEN